MHPYSGKQADNELNNTSYKESEVKGQKVMSIDYSEVAKGYWQSLDESTLIIKMKQRYGYFLHNIRCIDIALPFNPLLEVQTALRVSTHL